MQEIRREVAPDGHLVQLLYREWKAGRVTTRKWLIRRNGARAGYAMTEADAEVNFGRVMNGLMLNPETGRYEPGEVIVPDACPICGVDLKGEGHPVAHKTDEGNECEFVLDLPLAPDGN